MPPALPVMNNPEAAMHWLLSGVVFVQLLVLLRHRHFLKCLIFACIQTTSCHGAPSDPSGFTTKVFLAANWPFLKGELNLQLKEFLIYGLGVCFPLLWLM